MKAMTLLIAFFDRDLPIFESRSCKSHASSVVVAANFARRRGEKWGLLLAMQ